jgi:hypothetical protein
MSQEKKNPIYRNEEFVCENCGELNKPNRPEIRNHCRYCLHSKHVDRDVPGDRLSECKGLLRPIDVDYHKKKGWVLVFECVKCGSESRNMVVSDDNMDLVADISSRARLL